MPLQRIASLADLAAIARRPTVLFFSAAWSAPCTHMGDVLDALAKQHPGLSFFQVEAEEADDVTARFGVTAVPHCVLLSKDGAEVAAIEGADVPSLAAEVAQLAGVAPQPPAAAPAAARQGVGERIRALLASQPVVLFMKGSAASPYCGFSRRVVDALRAAGCHAFRDINVLQDEELRQGLKAFSNWPTFPQLFVAGELVGGCDIVTEMAAGGQLAQLLRDQAPASLHPPPAAKPPAPAAGQLKAQLKQRLQALIQQQPVMLFMKGTPEAPRCGFSRRVVEALTREGIAFGVVDVLADEAVRAGLKALAQWPSYPQLYVRGELLGGCDIVTEMAAAGQLKTAVGEVLHRTTDAN